MNNCEICWVCFPLRDGMEALHGELALLRREYFLQGGKAVRAGRSHLVKGFSGKLAGKLSRRSFYWKKTVTGASGGSVVLEEAFGRENGWLLAVRDFRGAIVSRTYFDKRHAWLKSEYYEPWDSTVARVVFSQSQGPGLIERQDWDQEKSAYRACQLYGAPYSSGTAEQNLIDAQLGQPLLVLLTTTGELCCCSKSQAALREKAQEEAGGGTMVLMPAWEIKEGELVSEDEDAAVSFTSLEEYAKIEPAPAMEPEDSKEESKPEPASGESSPAFGGALVEDLPAFDPPELDEAPCENQMEMETPGEDLSTGEASPLEEKASGTPVQEDGKDIPEEILQELAEGISTDLPSPKPLAAMPVPAGYQGDIRDGKATGKGRMIQPGGRTSYEGDYLDGQRHGFGAYYYKDGSLCYAGFWENDQRNGPGVSFRDSDHAMHVANWKEGQPEGLVSLFDGRGNLRYSGRFENGKKEGAGVVVNGQDGTVFVGQWSGGEATGLGSAFDREGRLLYYGGWKDGKRHGHGTEFDENGGVVFDGEWREDRYYNGVLYQKLSQPDWEQ